MSTNWWNAGFGERSVRTSPYASSMSEPVFLSRKLYQSSGPVNAQPFHAS